MTRDIRIPEETLKKQARASDPRYSAWVSANAGSGKTHVLARRVVRLLLEGTDPSRILCLTYTRAAAANMANRVFRDLAAWSLHDDERLSREIEHLGGGRPSREKLREARRLFARALETPGGLKIQTIHAFCEAILHQFPLEANIAGHFELLDPQMESSLLAEARRDLLSGAAAEEDDRLSAAFADVLQHGGEQGLEDLLGEIVTRREGLRAFIDAVANDAVPYGALFAEFGFGEKETARSVADAVWPLPGFPAAYFGTFVAAAEETDARTVLNHIVNEAAAAFAESDPERRLAHLEKGFLKGNGEPYGQKTFKKALCDRLPGLFERYTQAAEAVAGTADRLALFRMLEATRAALVIADRLLERYERLKHARGFLDFNDLIARTIRLLARPDAGAWVHYKLDKGIDHILIDEAQDTSPDQWRIVLSLAEEFFAGTGQRDNVHRTIFAVGDEKQSIYSFQGADPAAFAETGHVFEQKVPAAGGIFERVRLMHSFRSTDDVLSAVDTVFARDEARRGLTRDPEPMNHVAIRDGAPGYVELWSSLGPVEVEEPDDWTRPIDHASAPAARLAEIIAGTVAEWIGRGERIEGKGRRLRPGDIMVLVRKRDRFVHALSRSLKNRGIDVAGADRLRLTSHIAVQDLVALGRFVVQPHDDLSLAAVLKSPIFDVGEDTLFDLAWPRGDHVTLFEALCEAAACDPVLARIVDTLEAWRNAAAYKPVFEFFAGVLSGGRGRDEGARARLIARLGREAGDVLDEFLSFCLASERSGLSGLEAFLATLDASAPEIKREMDQTRDEVRTMTVHAAKGLEAPVVFLVDPGSAPAITQHLPRLIPFEPEGGGWTGRGFLWRAGKEVANTVSRRLEQEAAQKAEEEYRRLLYVGMTRAEDRLIVCGYNGVRGPSAPTWHSMVRSALDGAGETEELATPRACAPVYRYRITPASTVKPEEEPAASAERTSLPEDLLAKLPPAPALPRPLSPSGASVLIEAEGEPAVSARSPVLDADTVPSVAIERGRVIHRLLQTLPDMPPAERSAAAGRYLERACQAWPPAEREKTWRSVEAVLDDARFATIFRPGSRAEVSVMGTIRLGGREHAVSGKIDRLAAGDGEVVIVDYKTNRPPPAGLAEVPPAYVAQLALYAEILKPLYPAHPVRAALLFTEAPLLIPVPEAEMQRALARITTP